MKGAALPDGGYTRPNGLIRSNGQITVRATPENGSTKRDFDFRKMQLGEEIEVAFAEGFERAVGAGGTRRTKESIATLYSGIRAFAKLLNAGSKPPRSLSELRPAHVAALRLQGTRYSNSMIMSIRTVLRGNKSLPTPFRELLFAPMKAAPAGNTVAAYSESEFRAIRRSARVEIRAALQRIRALESELVAWQQQSGDVVDPEITRRGKLLTFIAENGNVPRRKDGLVRRGPADKGSVEMLQALFPTLSELAAVVVLMECLTGQNLSTICELTTAHIRADSQEQEGAILLTRASKPRRGRYFAEMDLTFASTPVWLKDGDVDGRDDYASPFGLFKIAEEMCRRAREFAGSEKLLCCYSNRRREITVNGRGFRPFVPESLVCWKGWTHAGVQRYTVDTMRLRRTFLELRQRPVAQKASTLSSTYLSKDPGSLATYQWVVGGALSDEVVRIRATNHVQTLSAQDVQLAAKDPDTMAQQLGISTSKLQELLGGRLDTIAAACIDPTNGPHDPAGEPCTASFLLCLSCPNARSEPRHIPVQALLSKRIRRRQLEMPPEQWAQKYQIADDQLHDLLRAQHANVDEMALQATDRDSQLIELLLEGRYDIR